MHRYKLYKLRTLLILMATVPPMVALAWLTPVYFGLLVVFLVYTVITLLALGIIGVNPARRSQKQ